MSAAAVIRRSMSASTGRPRSSRRSPPPRRRPRCPTRHAPCRRGYRRGFARRPNNPKPPWMAGASWGSWDGRRREGKAGAPSGLDYGAPRSRECRYGVTKVSQRGAGEAHPVVGGVVPRMGLRRHRTKPGTPTSTRRGRQSLVPHRQAEADPAVAAQPTAPAGTGRSGGRRADVRAARLLARPSKRSPRSSPHSWSPGQGRTVPTPADHPGGCAGSRGRCGACSR